MSLLAMNDTHAETLVLEVVTAIVERYGKKLTPDALQASQEALSVHSFAKSSQLSRCNAVLQASSGRRPLEAWQAVADLLGIDRTAQQLFDESEPLLEHRSAPRPHRVALQHQAQPGMASWQSLPLTSPCDPSQAHSNITHSSSQQRHTFSA